MVHVHKPVSYTHLYNLDDLSKNNTNLTKLKEALGNKNLTLEEMKSAEYADKIAYATVDGNTVSYTHLDVYKRQTRIRKRKIVYENRKIV